MEKFIYAHSFRDLVVYKQAFVVSRRTFTLSKGFPEDQKICAHEPDPTSVTINRCKHYGGLAKRRYERHFVSKPTDADGEQMEKQHWTRVAFPCGYLEESTARSPVEGLEQIGRLLQRMMDKAESFSSAPRIAEGYCRGGDPGRRRTTNARLVITD
jgi:23S rRNA-intervening sequence protein